MDDRTETPVVCSWARTHEFQSRFSREHKHVIIEDGIQDRTETPVVCHQRGGPQQFIIGDDEAELELSLGSRSFLERVNDQVRKRQKRSSCNPFSTTTKKMIQDVGNVELFELFETDPKTQCKECLSYWSEGIVF